MSTVSWKNGGGTTRTLAVEPANASTDDFLWRISFADITAPGSFSCFPGVDRIIMLWQGEGVLLRSPSWRPHSLSEPWQPFAFAGEDDVTCELLGGPTSDLNVMTRRGAASAQVRTLNTADQVAGPIEDMVLICAAGRMVIDVESQPPVALTAGYFVRMSNMNAAVSMRPETTGTVYVCALIFAHCTRGFL